MAADGGSNEDQAESRIGVDPTREAKEDKEAGRRVVRCRCPEPDCPCKGLSFTGHHVDARTSVRRRRVPFTVLDDSVVNLLDTHRVLTTPQLIAATGAADRTLDHRLLRLRQAGLVARARPYRDTGSAPFHWWLTPRGLRLVGHETTTRRPNNPAPLFLAHTTAVAGLWLALRDAPGIELVSWHREEAAWEEWLTSTGWSRPMPARISPDATVRLALEVDGSRGEVSVFVEVDLSTMTQDRLRAKVTRYRRYAASKAWKGRHPHCPVLLFATTSEQRATRFLAGTAPKKTKPSPFVVSEEAAAAAADLEMVVGACAAVRRPTDAVVGLGWRTGPTADVVALSTLLAANVAAGRRRAAREAAEEAEAAKEAPRLAIYRLNLNGGPICSALGAEWAVETLRAAISVWYDLRYTNADDDWADVHAGELLVIGAWAEEVVGAYHRNRKRPEPTAEVFEALRTLSRELWADQADAVLAQRYGPARHDPRLVLRAQRLTAGRLVEVHDLKSLLDRPLDVEAALKRNLGDHDQRRRDWIAAQRATQNRRQRRAVTDEALAASYDEAHLSACDICAWPDAQRRRGDSCIVCYVGYLRPWSERPAFPDVDQVLDALAAARSEVA